MIYRTYNLKRRKEFSRNTSLHYINPNIFMERNEVQSRRRRYVISPPSPPPPAGQTSTFPAPLRPETRPPQFPAGQRSGGSPRNSGISHAPTHICEPWFQASPALPGTPHTSVRQHAAPEGILSALPGSQVYRTIRG